MVCMPEINIQGAKVGSNRALKSTSGAKKGSRRLKHSVRDVSKECKGRERC